MNESALLNNLREKTSIEWEAVDGEPDTTGIIAWQLMPYDACENAAFWPWHLSHARQWFPSIDEAVASLLRSWAAWQQRN